MTDSAQTLAEIARLGGQSKTRRNNFSREAPSRWEPETIINTESGLPFSTPSAWELICKLLLESPGIFTELKLQKPCGQTAYWATITLIPSNVVVYIKVQLTSGLAHGRSFHISTKGVADV